MKGGILVDVLVFDEVELILERSEFLARVGFVGDGLGDGGEGVGGASLGVGLEAGEGDFEVEHAFIMEGRN
jgi:hypothetical protein